MVTQEIAILSLQAVSACVRVIVRQLSSHFRERTCVIFAGAPQDYYHMYCHSAIACQAESEFKWIVLMYYLDE